MEQEPDFTLEEWTDIFVESVRNLGYEGPIDTEFFFTEYEAGKMPEEAAEEFVNEMNS